MPSAARQYPPPDRPPRSTTSSIPAYPPSVHRQRKPAEVPPHSDNYISTMQYLARLLDVQDRRQMDQNNVLRRLQKYPVSRVVADLPSVQRQRLLDKAESEQWIKLMRHMTDEGDWEEYIVLGPRGTEFLETANKPLSNAPHAPISYQYAAQLTDYCTREVMAVLPTESDRHKSHELVKIMQSVVEKRFPDYGLVVCLFGSAGSQLEVRGSDVDICLRSSKWKPVDKEELFGFVNRLKNAIRPHGMTVTQTVLRSKSPLLKIWIDQLKLHCDLTLPFDSGYALENTNLIRSYCDIDPRVRPLITMIKTFAKRRFINNAATDGTLNSYSLVLMIIAYLQMLRQPILPVLQQEKPTRIRTYKENGKDIELSYCDKIGPFKERARLNKMSIGELLYGWFAFYSEVRTPDGHRYDQHILSIRTGTALDKFSIGSVYKSVDGRRMDKSMSRPLVIEEPFMQWNTAAAVSEYGMKWVLSEFNRAYRMLRFEELPERIFSTRW